MNAAITQTTGYYSTRGTINTTTDSMRRRRYVPGVTAGVPFYAFSTQMRYTA